MTSFRNGAINILVATDVAARGIDIDNIECVINYDLPQENELYVHRIGRSARKGQSGVAISFATSRSSTIIKRLLRSSGISIPYSSASSINCDEVKVSR